MNQTAQPLMAPRLWSTDLRQMLALAWPNVAASAAETVMSFIDFAIISVLGPQAQAAMSSGAMVFFSVYGLLLGMMICVTTVVSQSLGANRPRDCAAYGWQGIWLSLVFGTIGVVVWPVVPHFFAFVGHDPVVQAMETEYTQIRLAGLTLAGMSVALGHFFNGIQHPRINTYSVVGSVAVNAVLCYGLVQGAWGLPGMGLAGAALATVVANAVRVVWLLIAMIRARVARPFEASRTWRLSLDKLSRLVWVGLPSGLTFALDITAWATLFVVIIGRFGTDQLAATAICWRYTELSFMPAVGIGFAVATLVGRSVGEGRFDLARRWAKIGLALNMSYMGLMAVVFVAFRYELIGLFSHDPEVVYLGAGFLVLTAVFQLSDALGITLVNALRGAGDTRWPAVVVPAMSWGLMVGGSALLARFRPEWGGYGPWACSTVVIILVGAVLALRWRNGAWEKIDVIGRPRPEPAAVEVSPFDQYPIMTTRQGPAEDAERSGGQ